MAKASEILTTGGVLVWCFLSVVTFGALKDIPPQIEFPSSQDQVIVKINEREHFTVPCTATGDPAPTYQWKKDDIELYGDEAIKPLKNGTLYFTNFSDKENGLYQCVATNKYGTSLSVKVPLVNEKPAVKGNLSSDVVELTEGLPGSLKCAGTPETVPVMNKRWYESVGALQLIPDQRVGTDSTGTLRFAFINTSDAKLYTCGLVPEILPPLGEIIMYNTIKLQVKRSREGKDVSPPQLQFSSGDTKAIIGQSLTIECFFSGKPLPKIMWQSNKNTIIQPGDSRFQLTDFDRRLKILEVKDDDQGSFSCTGDNGFGQDSANIFVNVTSPPIKLPHLGLVSGVKTDRHKIVLQCKVRVAQGETYNSPVWYRNGQLLNEANLPDSERYNFEEDYTELHIDNPNKTRDTANFQCNVSNSEGYAFYDAYLKVIESIKVTKQPQPLLEISRDDVIDISVNATGDSCCNIVKDWYLNGVHLSKEDLMKSPFQRDKDKDVLLFNPRLVSNETQASRFWNFLCNVSNKYDFQEVKFLISLKANVTSTSGPPVQDLLTAEAGGIGLWWVALVCGILIIIIAAVIIVIFIKINYPGETYQLEKREIEHQLNPKQDLLDQSFQEL